MGKQRTPTAETIRRRLGDCESVATTAKLRVTFRLKAARDSLVEIAESQRGTLKHALLTLAEELDTDIQTVQSNLRSL